MWSKALTLVLIAAVVAACGAGSPASPSTDGINDPFGSLGIGCGEELDGWRCTLTLQITPEVSRDVTGLATWSTSDPSIATVNSVGFVTVLQSGEVAIRAAYRDNAIAMVMRVELGAGRRYYRALSGWVTDAQSQAKLTDVTVQVVSGTNAGRTASTGAVGAYQFYDLDIGAFTLRFTKSGYVSAERTFTLTGDHYNSLDVALTR